MADESLSSGPDGIWPPLWPGSIMQQQRPSWLDRLGQRPHPVRVLAQVNRQPPSPLAAAAPEPDQHVSHCLPGALGLLNQHQPNRVRCWMAEV